LRPRGISRKSRGRSERSITSWEPTAFLAIFERWTAFGAMFAAFTLFLLSFTAAYDDPPRAMKRASVATRFA
jgi:hypothetical protein